MTGYGKSSAEFPGKKVTLEVKTLNGKTLDLNVKIPGSYREKEFEMRSLLSQVLDRGKVDLTITVESLGSAMPYALNKPLALHYYRQLRELAEETGARADIDYLSVLVRIPEVFIPQKDEIGEAEWEAVIAALREALVMADRFRAAEGSVLEADLRIRIGNILTLLSQVEPFEQARVAALRDRLRKGLAGLMENDALPAAADLNRFEQELLYYLEKMDFSEEKVRLKKHCDYFCEALDEAVSNGKKLNFISQEIGREINTLGSKASDVDIQQLVVRMKEELEKIKEQLANIL